MKKLFAFLAVISALLTLSCNKAENVISSPKLSVEKPSGVLTKAVVDKSPSSFVYVETNDVNPLNALDYYLDDGTPYFDYVCFFSSNIHKETIESTGEVRPTLYLNPELTPYLCNNGSPITTYTEPFHEQDQEVILGVLGDWVGLGLSNMSSTQQYQFAYILCCVVTQCGFDGVLFDDEYSGSNSIVNGSYSGIITYFKQLCPNKKVFVFDWGGSGSISSTASSYIKDAQHGYFNYYLPLSYCNIPGIGASQWSSLSIQLGNTYSTSAITTLKNRATSTYNAGYDQIMFFNLRAICSNVDNNAVDPSPVLDAVAEGAQWGNLDTVIGGCRAKLTPVSGGCTITYDMALNCCN